MACTTKQTKFAIATKKANRLIVAHETCYYPDNALDYLQDNDVLFFDDCLYSQYVFIKNNICKLRKKNINCVLGFSTSIYRKEGQPIFYAVCKEQHDKFHAGDINALQAYMSLAEIQELVNLENVFIACHGDKHIQLDQINGIVARTSRFILDLSEAARQLDILSLNTNIYVFPYAYDEIAGAYAALRKAGFLWVFAGKTTKRTPIESLFNPQQHSRNVQSTYE